MVVKQDIVEIFGCECRDVGWGCRELLVLITCTNRVADVLVTLSTRGYGAIQSGRPRNSGGRGGAAGGSDGGDGAGASGGGGDSGNAASGRKVAVRMVTGAGPWKEGDWESAQATRAERSATAETLEPYSAMATRTCQNPRA